VDGELITCLIPVLEEPTEICLCLLQYERYCSKQPVYVLKNIQYIDHYRSGGEQEQTGRDSSLQSMVGKIKAIRLPPVSQTEFFKKNQISHLGIYGVTMHQRQVVLLAILY